MTNEALKTEINAAMPEAVFEENTEWLNFEVPASSWRNCAIFLRHQPQLWFDFLFCVTAVDWKTHLGMVYHLTSTTHRHSVVIKCKLTNDAPQIDTVSDIWRTAEFHEREAYELFGIIFNKHPDLRRLLLTDDFVGWPLRKNFEDPVNMIKL